MFRLYEECIRQQQDALAQILRDPIEQVMNDCITVWPQHGFLEHILLVNFSRIPYCAGLYALDSDGSQITLYVTRNGSIPGSIGWSHTHKPYMTTRVPTCGFLLSDAYFSERQQRPTITALQALRCNDKVLGYIGLDFDLRDMPFTAEWFQEPDSWLSLASTSGMTAMPLLKSQPKDSLDDKLDTLLPSLEELLTVRGIFQCHLHFASSQIAVWHGNDPYQYRIITLSDASVESSLLIYPQQTYPKDAAIPKRQVRSVLTRLRELRMENPSVYIRHASINIINGMINISLSCDNSQYLYYEDFLRDCDQTWLTRHCLATQEVANNCVS